MSGSASIQTGRRPVHRGESPDCPRETLDATEMEHLRRLAQFLLASARADGAGRAARPLAPGPGRRRRGRLGARRHGDSSPTAPRRSAPGPLTPLLAGVSAAASAQPLVSDPQLRLCVPFNPLSGIHRLYCHLFLIRVSKSMDGGSGGEEPCDDLHDACSPAHNHCVQERY